MLFTTSCKKEGHTSIVGKWTIIERIAGTGGGFVTSSYAPLSETSIEFKPNGDFSAYNNNSFISASALEEFDKYQMGSDNHIRLYKASSGESLKFSIL